MTTYQSHAVKSPTSPSYEHLPASRLCPAVHLPVPATSTYQSQLYQMNARGSVRPRFKALATARRSTAEHPHSAHSGTRSPPRCGDPSTAKHEVVWYQLEEECTRIGPAGLDRTSSPTSRTGRTSGPTSQPNIPTAQPNMPRSGTSPTSRTSSPTACGPTSMTLPSVEQTA